jgi:hypothetical protein
MKKIKTVLTAIAMLLFISSFATEPDKVSPVVKTAFENDFSRATEVNWVKSNDFYFASFTLNNVKTDAAYTEAGELVGTARRILSELMPLSVSLSIAEKFNGYTVDQSVIELTFEGVTRYYVTLLNQNQAVKLKCYSNGDLEIERKTKK